jgi:ATP-dependent Clp protease ATP-binding subunit ClpC
MTSNVGARIIEKATPLGFQKNEANEVYGNMKDNVLSELRKSFNPEFLNRVDEIVVFHPLEKIHLLSIIDCLLRKQTGSFLSRKCHHDREVKEWIWTSKPAYGARPMRRAIQKVIEDPLAEEILKGHFKGIYKIKVILEAGTPVFVASEEAAILSGIN